MEEFMKLDACWDSDYQMYPTGDRTRSSDPDNRIASKRKIEIYQAKTPFPRPTNRNCFYRIQCQGRKVNFKFSVFDFQEGGRVWLNEEQIFPKDYIIGQTYSADLFHLRYETDSTEEYSELGFTWSCSSQRTSSSKNRG